jgi:hypothetical protein
VKSASNHIVNTTRPPIKASSVAKRCKPERIGPSLAPPGRDERELLSVLRE